MKLYRRFIRPMHSYPGPDYSPRVVPIEAEVKWYPEEEREQLGNKYASYDEGSFSDLTFEEKYELYAIEPEYVKEQEAVEPKHNPLSPTDWFCGKCGMCISRFHDYCPSCGQEVKWDENT